MQRVTLLKDGFYVNNFHLYFIYISFLMFKFKSIDVISKYLIGNLSTPNFYDDIVFPPMFLLNGSVLAFVLL